jgi:hypothetical protein
MYLRWTAWTFESYLLGGMHACNDDSCTRAAFKRNTEQPALFLTFALSWNVFEMDSLDIWIAAIRLYGFLRDFWIVGRFFEVVLSRRFAARIRYVTGIRMIRDTLSQGYAKELISE